MKDNAAHVTVVNKAFNEDEIKLVEKYSAILLSLVKRHPNYRDGRRDCLAAGVIHLCILSLVGEEVR